MQKMQINVLNRELLERAKEAFRPSDITPETSKDKIMFEAGAMKALNWLDREMSKKQNETKVMAPEQTNLPDSKEGFLRRVSKGVTND